jgi:hypothetical protein
MYILSMHQYIEIHYGKVSLSSALHQTHCNHGQNIN